MKVEIDNPNGIVQDAWVEIPSPLALVLIVDSDFRMPRPSSYGFDTDDNGMTIHDFWYRSDSEYPDIVTITAENDEENNALKRHTLELIDKRQHHFVYCDRSVWMGDNRDEMPRFHAAKVDRIKGLADAAKKEATNESLA